MEKRICVVTAIRAEYGLLKPIILRLNIQLDGSILGSQSRMRKRKETLIEKTIFDYNFGIAEMRDYLILDIDSEEDFVLMSMLTEYFGTKDKEFGWVIELTGKLQRLFMRIR